MSSDVDFAPPGAYGAIFEPQTGGHYRVRNSTFLAVGASDARDSKLFFSSETARL